MEIERKTALDLMAKIGLIKNELNAIEKVLANSLYPNKVAKKTPTKTKYAIKLVPNYKTMPYAEYLKTEHWESVRKRALRRAKYKCELCYKNDEMLDVHHKTYERLGKEQRKDVIVLCRSCHSKFHEKLPDHAEM